MEYITLNNQVKMSILGLGTFMLEPDDAQAAVECALANGYELIDTANAYVNEKAVGRGMKASGKAREEIFLETKLWPCFYESDTAVDETLERLGADYIDLMILHQPAGDFISGYRKLEAAYKAGKLRAIGVSNFNEAEISQVIEQCDVMPAIVQMECHPYFPRTASPCSRGTRWVAAATPSSLTSPSSPSWPRSTARRPRRLSCAGRCRKATWSFRVRRRPRTLPRTSTCSISS